MMDFIDILIAKLAIWSIKRGYGANCKTMGEGCPSCAAKNVIIWLEEHISLIKG